MKIAISAGELSGDEHGAALLHALKRVEPGAQIRGMGLRNLREAGLELVVDAEQSGAIMGFTEVLSGLTGALGALSKMKQLLRDWRPDALVIINYSEFNLALARAAKKVGVKVLFYIPPQVWAWRASRVATIDRYVDCVATIYPFERAFYEKRGCDKVVYVGHPFTDSERYKAAPQPDRERELAALGFDPRRPVVALFPGSRRKEIAAHSAFMAEVFRMLAQQASGTQGMVVSARPDWVTDLRAHFTEREDVRIVHGDSVRLLGLASAGLVKSGTSNLQAVFMDVPFLMYYKTSRLSAFLVRRLVPGLTQYSIVNILRSDTVREIVGERPDAAAAADELRRLIVDTEYRGEMLQNFAAIRRALQTPDSHAAFSAGMTASERVAALVRQLALT